MRRNLENHVKESREKQKKLLDDCDRIEAKCEKELAAWKETERIVVGMNAAIVKAITAPRSSQTDQKNRNTRDAGGDVGPRRTSGLQ